ncbi:MAG: hypothetical protein ACHQ49_14775 [Elusimicrobiota bacterium]
MAPKVKVALGAMSDAFETACGWAFCVVALYALFFMNLTGNGALWDSLRNVVMDASVQTTVPKNAVVQMRVVPVRPVDTTVKVQNRLLQIPDEPEEEFSVAVLASQQPARAVARKRR